jgi:hypothetical protein
MAPINIRRSAKVAGLQLYVHAEQNRATSAALIEVRAATDESIFVTEAS